MQEYYMLSLIKILKCQSISKTEIYDFMLHNLHLKKEATIILIDALLDNPLLNFNYFLDLFMPKL